ncbi:MAG: hypothetical protein JST47_04480 [Bacteroidetes bacterium]|nr:hypothetical protein [Bacteroidota bacterium]
MKLILSCSICIALIAALAGCKQQAIADNKQLPIDSLIALVNHLKPGLGEFMLQIKYHHDSLGAAIAKKDYDRAAYEIDEIKETAERIAQLNIANDKLTKPFSNFYDKYLQEPLQILAGAASKKDDAALKTNFISLTNNCNSCHHENNMAFMKITP